MKSTDETIELLRGIRTDIQSVGGDVHCTREELSQQIEQLTLRLVESEERTATAITALVGTMAEMAAILRLQSELRPRVERCEEHTQD